MFIYYLTGIIVLPGILLAFYAQPKVTSAYNTYSRVRAASGITAYEFTRAALNRAGLNHIQITRTRGQMTDHYDHKNKRIGLSDGVYDSSSVAALSIAAHELGHALQYADKLYLPIKLRTFLIPVVNFTSRLMWPLVIVGMLMGLFVPALTFMGHPIGNIIMIIGLAFYGLVLILSLVTMPTETNASRRAVKILSNGGILTQQETAQSKKVLNAAALTYFASLVISFLQLLRILAIFMMGRRRN